MKCKSRKLAITLLLVTVLSTIILSSTSLASTRFTINTPSYSTVASSTTQDLVINEIRSVAEQQELALLSDTSESKDPAAYTDDEIRTLTWTQLTADEAIQIHHTYDRTMLKLAAYFYPDLLQLLKEEEKEEIINFSSFQLISIYDQQSTDNRSLLDTLTPYVKSKINELKQLESSIEAQATTPLPEVQYKEKDQEFRFARSKTEQSVDEVYRAANIVEPDVYLEGKHGLDLNLQRRYHSLSSKISAPGWNEDEKENVAHDPGETFATGWDFNTPRLDTVTNELVAMVRSDSSNPNQQIYYTKKDETNPEDNKGIIRYFIQLDDGTSLEYIAGKFVNYPYADAKFSPDPNNRKYTLYYRNLIYVFEPNKVTKSNIFGDKIVYNLGSDGEPQSIVDSVGRYIVLEKKQNNDTTQDLIVYKDSTKTIPLKHLRYNFYKLIHTKQYYQLNSVEVIPVQGSNTPIPIAKYAYYSPSTRGMAYFNFNKNYTLEKVVSDQALQESPKYWDADHNDRKEISYLLLQQAEYPLQGLKINYDYRERNPDTTLKSFKDGLVRIFLDKYALSYVSYHPVTRVVYSYTSKTPQGSETYKLEKSYESNDDEFELREIWKVQKSQLSRLANISARHGDTIYVTESEASRYTRNKTYKVNQDGNPLLKLVKTTGYSKGGTDFSGSKYQLSYNPTSYTSYAYTANGTKPTYQYAFLEPTSAVSDTDVFTNYLKNPEISKRSKYAAKLDDYAQETYFQYDSYGQVIKQINPDGLVTTWSYEIGPKGNFDVYSLLKSVKTQATTDENDPYYHVETYDYNTNYLLRKETILDTFPVNPYGYDDRMVERTYEYSNYRLDSVSERFGSGQTRSQTFDAYEMYGVNPTQISLLGVELESGKTQKLSFQLEYDEKSQLKSQTYPDGSKVHYDYDALGRVLSESFRNLGSSRTVSYNYNDSTGTAIVEKTLPDSTKLITYYTPYGDVAYQEQVGTNGSKRPLVANEFTEDGLQIIRTIPYGNTSKSTSYAYDWDGFLYEENNAFGTTMHSRVNAFADGSRYLPRGAEQTVSPNGYVLTTYQDLYGRVESTVEEAKRGDKRRVTNYVTDRFGKVTSKEVTDGDTTQSRLMRYDNNGSLVYLHDPENNIYEYVYDDLGNLTRVTENGVTSASYTYNSLSWKLSEKNPETSAEKYIYSSNGTVKSFTDKNNMTFSYTYTPFYELNKVTAGNGFYEEHVYDASSGKLLSENSTYGQAISYGYDSFLRNNRITMMDKDYQLSYEDSDDAIDAITYPSRSTVSGGTAASLKVSYAYDSANRLESVTIPGVGTTEYDYQVSSSGETDTVSYWNQSNAMEQSMNSFGELTAMKHADNWTESNGYDLFGNITSQKRGGVEYGSYAYDNLSRIKEETIQGNKKNYAYDRRGNRQIYAYGTGNVARSYELKHDVMNRLTEYKDENGKTTYTYYPNGLRASKQQTGSVADTTKYVYINGHVIEELTQDGKVKARNVWGNKLIWRKDYSSNQEGTYYYNNHGDVVKIKVANGEVVTYDYDIWGNLLNSPAKETMSNPFLYAGEMYDKESGFYYLRARYYDPGVGRFISEDTYKGQVDNPLTLNRYTYTANNPLRYIDASGNEYTEIGNSLTSNQRRMNVMLDQKTREAYINLYNKYGPDAIPAEHREYIGYLADPSSLIPGYGGVKVVRNTGKAVITAINGVARGNLLSKATKSLKGVDIKNFVIKSKHLDIANNTSSWSKFNVSTVEEANIIVNTILNSAKNNSSLIKNVTDNGLGSNGQQSFGAWIDAGKVIGTRGETAIRIVYDELGNIWTVFPDKIPTN